MSAGCSVLWQCCSAGVPSGVTTTGALTIFLPDSICGHVPNGIRHSICVSSGTGVSASVSPQETLGHWSVPVRSGSGTGCCVPQLASVSHASLLDLRNTLAGAAAPAPSPDGPVDPG